MEIREQYELKNQSIVSIGNWILTMVLLCIPIVNIIMLFVWSFSSGTPISKSNFAKAALIVWAILLLLSFIFWGSISRYLMPNPYYYPAA